MNPATSEPAIRTLFMALGVGGLGCHMHGS
jgi:hypothetical protein